MVHVLVIDLELHLPEVRSLKQKRSIVQSIVRTLDGWKGVGAAEVGHLERRQRAGIGIVVVGGTVGHVRQVADAVEREVWTRPGAEVIRLDRSWWDGSDET
jgi:uncharacterized protein